MNRQIPVSDLLTADAGDLQLSLLAGKAGCERSLSNPRIQKPGLALTGFTDFVHKARVQIFGSTEIAYLDSLNDDDRKLALQRFCEREVACIVCTKGMQVPQVLIDVCEKSQTPLFTSPQVTSVFVHRMQSFLEDKLAPSTTMHGVLIETFGVGVLLLGKSGIGKSECGLDLIQRGHRLVADDLVFIRRRGEETVYGFGNNLLQHHIEIRGLGILNIREMFGVTSIRDKKRIDLVVELVAWSEDEEFDRLGLDERRFPILDVELPLLTVPVRSGRAMGAIIEVAARNQLLRAMGVHSAREMQERLDQELGRGRRVAPDDLD